MNSRRSAVGFESHRDLPRRWLHRITTLALTTTALVLINGVIVASILIAVFLVLISIINQISLW